MIKLTGIVKKYGHLLAVDKISFEVKPGEILGFLGPNGAGKSTTIKIITGFHSPDSGQCLVGGIDRTDDPMAIRKLVGYLPESNPLYEDMTVEKFLKYMASLRDYPAAELEARLSQVLNYCSLSERRYQKIEYLSRGLKQRVGLAQALIHQPPILVLDEPTSGLDPRQVASIRNLIKSLGGKHTIIFSSHILAEVQLICDRVLIIDRGRLVANQYLNQNSSPQTNLPLTLIIEVLDQQPAIDLLNKSQLVSEYTILHQSTNFTKFSVKFSALKLSRQQHQAAILQELNDSGCRICQFYTQDLDLEEIFLNLTSQSTTEERN